MLNETRRELVQVLQILDPNSTSPSGAESSPATSQPSAAPVVITPPLLPTLHAVPSPLPGPSLADTSDPSLLSALNIPSVSTSLPPTSASPPFAYEPPSPENLLQNDALKGIDNPLEVLAHVSLHDREEAGSDSFAFAMQEESELISEADRYYATGLYTALDDTDGAEDPVSRGLLTDKDLRRLIRL